MQAVTIKMVGDWQLKIAQPLSNALRVSIDIFGRTAPEACKHAVILMAQSAKNMTPKAKKIRPELEDEQGKYVDIWTQKSREPIKIHKFRFSPNCPPESRLEGTWSKARRVKNAGLAARSWMWSLGKGDVSKEIPGLSRAYAFQTKKVVGFVKQNALSYVKSIMPAGWEVAVAQKATSRIMAQAAAKLERLWASTLRGSGYGLGHFVKGFSEKAA
ncbi:MAG: hypothetical protein ABFD59_08315 [Smithella sp.]